MQAITDIRRIEADLYRFIQTTSEARRLIHDYLGDLLFRSYVTQAEHDQEIEPLKTERDTHKESSEAVENLLMEIRDFIQESARKNFPDPDQLITRITRAIFDCEHACHIDDDMIYESLDCANLRPAFTATVVFSDTRPAGLSEIQTTSKSLLCATSAAAAPLRLSLPSPTTTHDHEKYEKQIEIRPAVRTPRRLPGISLGKSAA